MKYLNYSVEELESRGGHHTAKEICGQPKLWRKTYSKLLDEEERISNFLENVLKADNLNVVLTGAGSSAFIGEALVGWFQKLWGVPCRAIGTTEIVTHPENYFIKSNPTLLISFARSGDSPESVAAVEIAKNNCDNLYQLNITCNKNGALAKRTDNINSCVFLLPEETNDRSLAMTSSFSSMLLAGLLLANWRKIGQMKPLIKKIQMFGNYFLTQCLSDLKKISELEYERMVFLGSGPLFGIAHESHLKVQEMTDGKIICKFDSFLGFRHGPKAVVNNSTIIVYLFSNVTAVNCYERDLVRSVIDTAAGEKSLAIGYGLNKEAFNFDFSILLPNEIVDVPEDFLSVFYILPAQIIAFYKSMGLGLSPDSPSARSAISRVVQGVKIYNSIEV